MLFKEVSRWTWTLLVALFLSVSLVGCEGMEGEQEEGLEEPVVETEPGEEGLEAVEMTEEEGEVLAVEGEDMGAELPVEEPMELSTTQPMNDVQPTETIQTSETVNIKGQVYGVFKYQVRYGETVSTISQKIYGDKSMWNHIAAASNLGNANLIFPRQYLQVPVLNQSANDFLSVYTTNHVDTIAETYSTINTSNIVTVNTSDSSMVNSSPAVDTDVVDTAIAEEASPVDPAVGEPAGELPGTPGLEDPLVGGDTVGDAPGLEPSNSLDQPAVETASTDSAVSDIDQPVGMAGGGDTITVTVQPGESLSGIASRTLGSGSLWVHIWLQNRNSIPNPDRIAIGQVLSFPRASFAN